MTFPCKDWTCDEVGRSNSSERFLEIVREVTKIILADSHTLLQGGAHRTASLIVAQLAHKYNFGPYDDLKELARIAQEAVNGSEK